jgi:hypothetical protein
VVVVVEIVAEPRSFASSRKALWSTLPTMKTSSTSRSSRMCGRNGPGYGTGLGWVAKVPSRLRITRRRNVVGPVALDHRSPSARSWSGDFALLARVRHAATAKGGTVALTGATDAARVSLGAHEAEVSLRLIAPGTVRASLRRILHGAIARCSGPLADAEAALERFARYTIAGRVADVPGGF